ncbi:MAG: hypothetical protein ORN49_10185 [Rhodobacteraceae bacterium]|nr:hypothetical protein [Paracoccaceae bacterium]
MRFQDLWAATAAQDYESPGKRALALRLAHRLMPRLCGHVRNGRAHGAAADLAAATRVTCNGALPGLIPAPLPMEAAA